MDSHQIAPFTPSRHPLQGGMYGNDGQSTVAYLNTNSTWYADMLGIQTDDPTVQGRTCTIGGTITAGNQIGLRFQWGANDITIQHTVQTGDTLAVIANRIAELAMANATIAADWWIAAYTGNLTFQVQWKATITPTVTAALSAGATATATLSPAVTALDTSPWFFFTRAVPGHNAAAGDAIAAIIFQSSNASTDQVANWYASVSVAIQDATASDPKGRMYFGTADALSGLAGTLARFYLEKGIVLLDANGVAAAGGDMGAGTINSPNPYYRNGIDIRKHIGTRSVGGISLDSNQVITGANLAIPCLVRTGMTAPRTDTLQAASNIVASIPNCAVDTSWNVHLLNTTSSAWTIAPGGNTTFSGNVPGGNIVVGANSSRLITVWVTNVVTPSVCVFA